MAYQLSKFIIFLVLQIMQILHSLLDCYYKWSYEYCFISLFVLIYFATWLDHFSQQIDIFLKTKPCLAPRSYLCLFSVV
jgi:hypothetical protein